MLRHHPKLKKLWDKSPKIKQSEDIITLDMRYKSSKEFQKELCNVLIRGFKKAPIGTDDLMNWAIKK